MELSSAYDSYRSHFRFGNIEDGTLSSAYDSYRSRGAVRETAYSADGSSLGQDHGGISPKSPLPAQGPSSNVDE